MSHTRRIEPYHPPPARRTIFTGSETLVEGLAINDRRVQKVLAYVTSPGDAERIRRVVMGTYPLMWFEHIESPLAFVGIRDEAPTVIFVDDRSIADISRDTIRNNFPNSIIVLISAREDVCSRPPQFSSAFFPDVEKADLIAATAGADKIPFESVVCSFIRLAEDRMNIERQDSDPPAIARRFIVMVVDDEPRWFAEFLPELYSIIGRRADIITKRTYEDAIAFLDAHGDDVVCLISDMLFPKGGVITEEAGRSLVQHAHGCFSRIAQVVASKADSAESLRHIAYILPKGDARSLAELRMFIHDFAGFGDFIIPVSGRVLRIKSIAGLQDAIRRAELQVLEEYADRDYFSTWLYMHGFYIAGNKVRVDRSRGSALRDFLLGALGEEMVRLEDDPFVITDEAGAERYKGFSLREINEQIRGLPAAMLEKWEENDSLSFWLMRHGYAELADELRPLHGLGEDVKRSIAAIFERWIQEYEQRGVKT